MTGELLWRGMLAGVLAALLAVLFARAFAEPHIDRALAYEASHEVHAMGHDDDEGDPPVGRATQKGLGLATAVLLYGAAIGGLFALVFAYCHGRVGALGPQPLVLLIAALGFVAVVLVPALKYPPNPPAVGRGETIALRTGAYFAMIAISLAGLVVAGRVRALLIARTGAFDAMIAGGAGYVAVVVLAQLGLPRIDEVPADFPAGLLWNFRVAAIGMQLVLWTTLALAFGRMAATCLAKSRRPG